MPSHSATTQSYDIQPSPEQVGELDGTVRPDAAHHLTARPATNIPERRYLLSRAARPAG